MRLLVFGVCVRYLYASSKMYLFWLPPTGRIFYFACSLIFFFLSEVIVNSPLQSHAIFK